jgi:hypothetical protein
VSKVAGPLLGDIGKAFRASSTCQYLATDPINVATSQLPSRIQCQALFVPPYVISLSIVFRPMIILWMIICSFIQFSTICVAFQAKLSMIEIFVQVVIIETQNEFFF